MARATIKSMGQQRETNRERATLATLAKTLEGRAGRVSSGPVGLIVDLVADTRQLTRVRTIAADSQQWPNVIELKLVTIEVV